MFLLWATRDRDLPDIPDLPTDANLLILCSASARVRGTEASAGGYIQGAGDDSEAWARGLNALLFWRHRELLLRPMPDMELENIVDELVARAADGGDGGSAGAGDGGEGERQAGAGAGIEGDGPVQITPTEDLFVGSYRGARQAVVAGEFDVVINCTLPPSSSPSSADPHPPPTQAQTQTATPPSSNPTTNPSPAQLNLSLSPGKLGSRRLRAVTRDVAVPFVAEQLQRKQVRRRHVLVTCETGRDLSVGVVVVLACLLYGDDGG